MLSSSFLGEVNVSKEKVLISVSEVFVALKGFSLSMTINPVWLPFSEDLSFYALVAGEEMNRILNKLSFFFFLAVVI